MHTFVYAKWQAKEAIFRRNPKKRSRRGSGDFTKNKHIGRVGSSSGLGMDLSVVDAYQAWENRQKLEAIEKALADVETTLEKVMPLIFRKA
ncbi:hypothetical protein [Anabaena sp. CCY 9402-a]|uniref:hypothetical protein n=1 Tax=Anabaena sp. CCY 9402-a TaxID=3103867 RepID=UPI0039C7282D